jgi:hypothetical protein
VMISFKPFLPQSFSGSGLHRIRVNRRRGSYQ